MARSPRLPEDFIPAVQADPLELNESDKKMLLGCLTSALSGEACTSFLWEVSAAIGEFKARHRVSEASDVIAWRRHLAELNALIAETRDKLDIIASDEPLVNLLEEHAVAPTESADLESMARSLAQGARWRSFSSPKSLSNRLQGFSWCVESAIETLKAVQVPRGPAPDAVARHFIMHLGYAWKIATGKNPPKTTPTDTAPGGGPFVRFVSAANSLVDGNCRLPDQSLPILCRTVAREYDDFFSAQG